MALEGVLRRSEETRESYRQVAKMLALPMDQFEKEFEREAKKRAGNPVFKVLLPRRRQRASGPGTDGSPPGLAVGRPRRPAGRPRCPEEQSRPRSLGGPFEYVPFDGGFELRSNLKGRDDKPVSLTVGHRG